MSIVGQSESDDIFVSELKAKELKIIGSSVLLSLFQWENKNVDLITMGSLIFRIQIKISSDLLCPTILILPHPILDIYFTEFTKIMKLTISICPCSAFFLKKLACVHCYLCLH